jgi:hypothetical protein
MTRAMADHDTPLRAATQTVPLGTSGLSVFPIAWGMWRLASPDGKDDIGAVIARIEAALEAGITLFDTADIYGAGEPVGFGGAEALLGKALAKRPDLRSRMTIATKGGIWPGWPYNSSVAYLTDAIEASLARLGLGLVEVHRELMTPATSWIMAAKLRSVLQARMAMRLNSLSLPKKFSMRWRHLYISASISSGWARRECWDMTTLAPR